MNYLLQFGYAALAVSLVLFSLGVHCQDVLKCMSCKKASHFTHCEEMVKCDPEREVCYVEEEIDIGGETVVNAGCREKDQCDAVGCFGDVYKRRKRSSIARDDGTKTNTGDLNRDIVCHHCCNGDFCNMYGCPDSFDVSHLTGSRCFVCEHVLQPEHCNTIKNCEAGYSCGLERVTFGDGERYNLECIRTQKCDLLKLIHNNGRKKRNYVSLWADCCDTHLCNGYMPMKEDPPPLQSLTYRCPPRRNDATPNSSGNIATSKAANGTLPTTVATTTTTITKTTTETTTTKPTNTVTVCEDADSDCYKHDIGHICSGVFAVWAIQHCAKYCGFCGTTSELNSYTSSNDSSVASTTPLITTASICEDKDANCDIHDKDYICKGSNTEWAKEHCTKYCGYCVTNRKHQFGKSHELEKSGQDSLNLSSLIIVSLNLCYVISLIC